VLTFEIANTGTMTALFCQPHPLIEYRTDLSIINNNAAIPPGERRTIEIRAPKNARGGLTLVQTGWRFSCWNADDVIVPQGRDVLLSMGRRDATTREYLGYPNNSALPDGPRAAAPSELRGRRPDVSGVPLLAGVPEKGGPSTLPVVRFIFDVPESQAALRSQLRIHTADQSSTRGPTIVVHANRVRLETTVHPGLGRQRTEPAHLAFPATVTFDLPPHTWRAGQNVLKIDIKPGSWFTWDALDLVSVAG
jgi:beta-mannosidase